jgi:hypothetical protein
MSTENRTITASRIFLVVALILFVLAGLGVGLGGANLIAWGLAFLTASMVV